VEGGIKGKYCVQVYVNGKMIPIPLKLFQASRDGGDKED
jgi:hypothetical protein